MDELAGVASEIRKSANVKQKEFATDKASLPQIQNLFMNEGIVLLHYQSAQNLVRLWDGVNGFGFLGEGSLLTLEDFYHNFDEEQKSCLNTLFHVSERELPCDFILKFKAGWSGRWQVTPLSEGRSFLAVISVKTMISQVFEDLETQFQNAEKDGLTGLLTRKSFLQALSGRLKNEVNLILVIVDLVRVGRLNHALGYQTTDRILSELGDRLSQSLADRLPARIGDNSFAIVCTRDHNEDLDQLHQKLAQPFEIEGLLFYPELIVIDIASADKGSEDGFDFLSRGEQALYLAKTQYRSRRNPLSFEKEQDHLSQLRLESDLHGALERGEIVPFYHPIIRLEDESCAGFEALARWCHPQKGLLTPDEFLPLIVDPQQIRELSLMMIRKAGRQAQLWRSLPQADPGLFVSVNLTSTDLERVSLIDEVKAILAEENLGDNILKLEITEGEMMRNPDRTASLSKGLQDLGVALYLDDFGMGYSSLSWLARLPVSGLKIDRYFIHNMDAHVGVYQIVRSILNLAKDFGLQVVAEGIEREKTFDLLKELGCPYIQGFRYAKPLAFDEAALFLQNFGASCQQ